MRGRFFRATPKQRANLVNDYRDPEVPESYYISYLKAPLSSKFESECSNARSSLKNVFGDSWVMDALKTANLKPNVRVTQDVKYVNSMKNEFLKQAFLLEKNKKKVTPGELKFMLEELQDEGFLLTPVFVRRFCEIDQEFLAELAEITGGEKSRSPMGTDYEQLSLFVEVMKEWETAFKRGDRDRSFSIMLYLAMFYLKQEDQSLYCMVYQIFHMALVLVENVTQSEYCEAALRFIFGRFLLEKTNIYSEAKDHLQSAADLSRGRDSWSVTCITETEDDFIYRRSVYLKHLLLIIEADIASENGDVNKAVNLMEQSVALVDLVGSDEPIARAWLDLAVFYSKADLNKKAVVYALKSLKFFSSIGQTENIGISMLYLGIFYKNLEYFEEAHKILLELLNLAEDPSINCLQAEAVNQMEVIEEISLNSLLKKREISYGGVPCEPKLSQIRLDLRVYKKKAESKSESDFEDYRHSVDSEAEVEEEIEEEEEPETMQ